VVVFYNTLLPQKCTKLKTGKKNAQGHLGSNMTPERENRNFRKRLLPTAQSHYADLEDTYRDKVTKFGVIVRYTKKVIEKKNKRRLGSNFAPGGRLRVKIYLVSLKFSCG